IVAWPSAEIAVMSGGSASKVLLQIEEAKLKKKGDSLSKEDKQALLENIEAKYKESTSPYYAASRLWVDAIIDPVKTRELVSLGIEMANQNDEKQDFNMGVLQV
ncbi:MAG: carboxyl transferase domain-containing protein, partial [Flavobacteriaceae bacterium]